MTSRLTKKPGSLGHPSTLNQKPKQCVRSTGTLGILLLPGPSFLGYGTLPTANRQSGCEKLIVYCLLAKRKAQRKKNYIDMYKKKVEDAKNTMWHQIQCFYEKLSENKRKITHFLLWMLNILCFSKCVM
jgi:hypothetical protein